METDNVLTDQMKVCRPEFLKLICMISVTIITDSRNIVGKSVQPYIGNVLWVKVYRDTP